MSQLKLSIEKIAWYAVMTGVAMVFIGTLVAVWGVAEFGVKFAFTGAMTMMCAGLLKLFGATR
jgi:hypothetical protein